MTLQAFQRELRRRLWKEMKNGGLTGTALAARTGLKQAHISNFLNGKRGLSLEAMDRVLRAQRLAIVDLLDPEEVNEHASIPKSEEAEFQNIPLLGSWEESGAGHIDRRRVREILKFRSKFLNSLRAACDPARARWERFVAVRVEARQGMSMYPRLLPGATILIDRHYNSAQAYRRDEQTMLVIQQGKQRVIRYLERVGEKIVLRPHNPAYPVEMLEVARQHSVGEYVIGRVAHIGIET